MRFEEITQCPAPTGANGFSANHNNKFIKLVELAYSVYVELKLITDQQQFSIRVLGKSHSYLSCMKSRKRTPTQPVLFRLLRDVRIKRELISDNPHFGKPYAMMLNRAFNKLVALEDIIERVLIDKCGCDVLDDNIDDWQTL